MPAEQLVLINPRHKTRRGRARHGRNPKRRMPAALRRYWAARRGTRLRNPRARRRRDVLPPNYYRRRKKGYRNNPRRRHFVRRFARRLRNPRGDGLMDTLLAGAMGAGGALLLNVVYGYVNPYLPASLQTGLVQTAVLAVGAVGLGYLVGRVNKDLGNDVTFGGLTVVLYNAASTIAQSAGLTMTNNLAGYADYTPMGAYMRGTPATAGFRSLGYISPAPVIRAAPRLGAYMQGTPATAGFRPLGAYMRSAPMNVAPVGGNWGDGM